MIYNQLYKDVKQICQVVTKNSELCDDLTNEVMIIAIDLEDIEDRYTTDKKRTLNFLMGIAYKQYNWQGSPFNRVHNNTYFDSKEKKWLRWNTQDIEEFRQVSKIDNELDFMELISSLNEIEQIWMCEWYIRNCNVKKLSEDSGLSRPSINKALNQIFKKLRK